MHKNTFECKNVINNVNINDHLEKIATNICFIHKISHISKEIHYQPKGEKKNKDKHMTKNSLKKGECIINLFFFKSTFPVQRYVI